jgi:hypothetical protein
LQGVLICRGSFSAMTRILAIALAFLIGAPNCWCCVLKKETPKPIVHECCKMSQDCPLDQNSTKPRNTNDDSCGCDVSKTRRDMGSPVVALPAPVFSVHEIVYEMLKAQAVVKLANPPRLEDDGPPLSGCPLYVSHCALRP